MPSDVAKQQHRAFFLYIWKGMASSSFKADIERQSDEHPMAQNGYKAPDGRKKVLIVGAGAAGYGSSEPPYPPACQSNMWILVCLRHTTYRNTLTNSM